MFFSPPSHPIPLPDFGVPLCFFVPALQAEAVRLMAKNGDHSAAMDSIEAEGHVALVRACAGTKPGLLSLAPRISKGALAMMLMSRTDSQ